MARAGLARVAVTSILLSSIFSVWFTFDNLQQPAYATESQKTWAKRYGSIDPDIADAFGTPQQTSDGGYIASGYMGVSDGCCEFVLDAWILKLDSGGNVEWDKTYGGSSTDESAGRALQTADGGYIVPIFTHGGVVITKLDPHGNIEFQKGFSPAGGIRQSSDGGYILAGSSGSNLDILLIKLDSDFNVEWEKTYGGAGFESITDIQQTSEGGYVVTANTNSFGSLVHAWVLKVDQDGNVEWQKAYGGEGFETVDSIDQTSDGGYVMAGRFGPCCSSVVWVLKLGSDGNVEWEKTYSGGGDDFAHSIEQTPDGGYIVAAETYTFGFGDLWLIKLDPDGKIEWQKVYLGFDFPSGVHQTTDGGLIAVGASTDPLDAWILKLDSDGNIDQCTSPVIQDTNAVETDTVNPTFDTSADVADSTSTIVEFTTTAQEHTTLIDGSCALSPSYSLNLFEGSILSDLILDLGQEARAFAKATDHFGSQVNFTWNNPSGHPVHTQLVPWSLTGNSEGQAEDTFTPDEVGRWTVIVDFGNGVVRQQTFDVRMLVVPESPIGLIALVVSSFAALGAYVKLRPKSPADT